MAGTRTHLLLALVAGAALAVGGCTATTARPSPSASGLPTASASGTPTPAPASSPPASSPPASSPPAEPTVMPTTASATLFYVAIGDNGVAGPMVGCGDSAVAVTSAAITYTDPVEGALRALLANHTRAVGASGLDNTLWQSRLAVASVDRSGATVTAHLSGTLTMGGECDIPRIEQQLMLTAERAAGAPVAITINGKTLTEALSLK
ncbi:hypothetical protein AB4Y80_07350 [Specibacter sp. RAF43]